MATTNHVEAPCLAFSDIHLGGMKWSVTIRQGVTQKDIDGLLDKIVYLTKAAGKKGFRFPGSSKAEEGLRLVKGGGSTKRSDAAHQVDGVGVDADDSPVRVGSFKVTGTKDKPVVELYSANKKLKFPVLKPPFSVLEGIVRRGYPDHAIDLTTLSTCGEEREIDWIVEWEASPKNPKWRDLVAITIPKFGPPKEGGPPARPMGDEELQEGYEPVPF